MTDYSVDVGWCEDLANATSGDPTYDDYFYGLRTTRRPSEANDVVRLEDLEETLFIGIPGSGSSIIDTPDLSNFSCGGGEGALLGIYDAVDASNDHYGLNYYAFFAFDAGTGGIATEARVQPFVNPANAVDCTNGYWIAVGGRYEAGDKLLAQRLGVRVPGASLDDAALTIGAWREPGADNDRWISFRRLNAYSGNAAPPKYAFIYNEDIVDPYGFFISEILDEEASPITTQVRFVITDWRADGAYTGQAGSNGGFGFNTVPATGQLASANLDSTLPDAIEWFISNTNPYGGIMFKAQSSDALYHTSMGVFGTNHSYAKWSWTGWAGSGSAGVCLGGFGTGPNPIGASLVVYGPAAGGAQPAHAIAFKGNSLFFGSTDVTSALATLTAGGLCYYSSNFYFCDGVAWYSLGASLQWQNHANGIYYNQVSKGVAVGDSTPSVSYALKVGSAGAWFVGGIYSDATIGLGLTASANYPLRASKSVDASYLIALYNANAGSSAEVGLFMQTSASNKNLQILIGGPNHATYANWASVLGGAALTGIGWGFSVGSSANLITWPDGDCSFSDLVGIKVTNPLYELHVDGNGYFTGFLGIGIAGTSQHPLYVSKSYDGVMRLGLDNTSANAAAQCEFMAMVSTDANESIAIGVCGKSHATLANWGYVLAGSGITNGIGWGYVVGSSANFITYPSGLTKFNSAGVGIDATPTTYQKLAISHSASAVSGTSTIYLSGGPTIDTDLSLNYVYGIRNLLTPIISHNLGNLSGDYLRITFNNNPAVSRTVSSVYGRATLVSLGSDADNNLNITSLYGHVISITQNSGSLANVGNVIGIYIDDMASLNTYGGANIYGIRQVGVGALNYFDGKIRTDTGFNMNGTDGVTTFGPAAVSSITVKGGIVTAIS